MTVPLPPAATSKSNTSASEWLLTLLTSVLILPLFRPSSPVSKAMIVLGGSRRWRCFPSPPRYMAKYWREAAGLDSSDRRLGINMTIEIWNKSSWTQKPLLNGLSRPGGGAALKLTWSYFYSCRFSLMDVMFFWRSCFALKFLISTSCVYIWPSTCDGCLHYCPERIPVD